MVGGEFYIVGLFPMNCSTPNEIDNRTIAWMEAMKYTIEEENKKYNRSIFGYVIYDTYDPTNMDMTSFAVLDSLKLSNQNFCNNDKICMNLNGQLNRNQFKNILGFVGPAESSTSIYVHALTSVYEHIPIISYAAVSLELNDKTKFPNFFRTVPADNFQAEFIKKVLQKYKWNFISVIAVDSSYGRAGLEILKQNYESDDICIDVLEILQQAYDPKIYSKIAEKLITSTARVIVFWGQFRPFFHFLQEALNLNLSNRIWIVSKAVGKNSFFLNFKNTLNNKLLFVSYTAGEDQKFKNYFFSLTYENSSEWLKVIFERSRFSSNSNVNAREIKEVFDLSGVSVVQNAVKIYIKAFYQYQGFSWTYNATYLDTINNTKYGFLKNKSVCYDDCKLGEIKVISNTGNCCWSCSPCADNHIVIKEKCVDCGKNLMSDKNKTKCVEPNTTYWSFNDSRKSLSPSLVLLSSSFGILTSIFFIYTFIRKKSTPIVRSSYYELSLVQMALHLIWYLIVLSYFYRLNYMTCKKYKDKVRILKESHRLKGTSFFINEDFSRETVAIQKRLFAEVKQRRSNGENVTESFERF
nr:metabotropic glutamate receptor 3-like [Hydra vulgaris]